MSGLRRVVGRAGAGAGDRGIVIAVLLALLAACGGSGTVMWRELELQLPPGWQVFENAGDRLSLANGPLGASPGARGSRDAAAFFTVEPGTGPGDWRAFVDEVGGTIETDEQLRLDGVPATRLVFRHDSNGIPIREMVVLVPARDLVVLMQPLVLRDSTDGPQRFEAHRAEFETILDSIRFGAPVQAVSVPDPRPGPRSGVPGPWRMV